MSSFLISSNEENLLFTGVNDEGQWIVYWLVVSGLNFIQDLSFNTNVFLDQISEAKNNKREGIVVHQFNHQGDYAGTEYTLHEKGLEYSEKLQKISHFLSKTKIKDKPININTLDDIHKRVHFLLTEEDDQVITLHPRNLSWKNGKPLQVEEARKG